MPRKRVDPRAVEVVLVPSTELGPNPQNPYSSLTTEERYQRYVALLAGIYEAMIAEEAIKRDAA